jgi:hypothetical protein
VNEGATEAVLVSTATGVTTGIEAGNDLALQVDHLGFAVYPQAAL